jgi:hypothetical protein
VLQIALQLSGGGCDDPLLELPIPLDPPELEVEELPPDEDPAPSPPPLPQATWRRGASRHEAARTRVSAFM